MDAARRAAALAAVTWQAEEREQARMLRSGIVVLVDAAYRDGWAGIAGVICFPGDRLQERLFVASWSRSAGALAGDGGTPVLAAA